jgi:hypothetical protein
MDGPLIGGKPSWAVVDDLEALLPEVFGTKVIQFDRKSGQVNQREPLNTEGTQREHGRDATDDHGDIPSAHFQACFQSSVVDNASHIAAAGEVVSDSVQRCGGE